MNDTAKSLLVDALLEAEGAELVNTECTFVPTDSFSRRIQRLTEHPEKYTKNRRVKKAVIILIAAAVILTGCAAVKPVRKTIANFIITVFDKYSSVGKSTDTNAKDRITEFYSPGFIPEEYEFAGEIINSFNDDFVVSRQLEYKKDNYELYYNQAAAAVTTMAFDSENAEIKTFTVNGIECVSSENEKSYIVIWEQYGYRFMISTSPGITEETAVKIIESMKKDEFTNN